MDTTVISTETYISLILGAMSLKHFIVLFSMGLFGLVCSLVFDLYRNWNKILKTGGFQWDYWLKKNLPKIFVSMLVIIVAILFSETLIGREPDNTVAFFASFFLDKTIDSFIKRKP
jgi:hypothetical protein